MSKLCVDRYLFFLIIKAFVVRMAINLLSIREKNSQQTSDKPTE
jgi:hypothetical protein